MRMVKPGFFADEDLAECSPYARLLFIFLWTEADIRGVLEDRPKRIRAAAFPYEPDVDVDAALEELQRWGFIRRYTGGGKRCLLILGFTKHQKTHPNEPKNELPMPTEPQLNIDEPQLNTDEPQLNTARRNLTPTSKPLSLTKSLTKSLSSSLIDGGCGGNDAPPIRVIPQEHVSTTHTRKKKSLTLPDDFALTPERRSYAEKIGIPLDTIADEFEDFRLWHTAHGSTKINWHAAWQLWVRKAKEFAERDATRFTKNGTKPASRVSVFGDGDGGLARWKAEEEAKRHA